MTEYKIGSWDELVSCLQSLQSREPVSLACRGENQKYLDDKKHGIMKPKLDRSVSASELKSRLRMERAICQRFREHAPIYLSDVERRYLKTRWLQLVVMQHYGIPTRLLDWTKSAWVASFFAVFGSWTAEGYVYGFHRDVLEDRIRELYGTELHDIIWGPDPNEDEEFFNKDWDWARGNDILFNLKTAAELSSWVATFYCREGHFPRLIAQQGIFTFASQPDYDHWEFISNLVGDKSFILEIEAAAKPGILRGLNGLGLNGATLFPGMEGIGRSLEGFARAWDFEPTSRQS